ncbi:hypothetical protein [Kitasatospora sp. NPDC056531]|uniref:hypothetical protein n=1 Tax=Kitasatospora sp. NPDC056531 TaxID=3345856 RepID=UPI00369C7BE9
MHLMGTVASCKEGGAITRVRVQTANLEGADDYGPTDLLAHTYSVVFENVPTGGEKAEAYVTCTDFSGADHTYGNEITINRPLVGDIVLTDLAP